MWERAYYWGKIYGYIELGEREQPRQEGHFTKKKNLLYVGMEIHRQGPPHTLLGHG